MKPGRIETRPVRHDPPASHGAAEQECGRCRAVIRSLHVIGADRASKFADDHDDRVLPDGRQPFGKRRQRRVERGQERCKAAILSALICMSVPTVKADGSDACSFRIGKQIRRRGSHLLVG